MIHSLELIFERALACSSLARSAREAIAESVGPVGMVNVTTRITEPAVPGPRIRTQSMRSKGNTDPFRKSLQTVLELDIAGP